MGVAISIESCYNLRLKIQSVISTPDFDHYCVLLTGSYLNPNLILLSRNEKLDGV